MARLYTAALAAGITTLAFSSPALAEQLMIDVEGARIENGALVFPAVEIDKDGYVVIHAIENGQPVIPASIGHTAVAAGETANVAVQVEGGAMPGTPYLAMIHYETNGNGTYDFGEGMTDVDTPGMKADGTPYALPVTVAN